MSDTIVITQNNIEIVEVSPSPAPSIVVTETINSVEVSAPGPQGPPGPAGPVGPPGSQELVALEDVNITDPTDRQALVYDADTGLWINASGALGATELTQLTDVNISSVDNGDVLSYNTSTTKWVNEARVLLTDGGNF